MGTRSGIRCKMCIFLHIGGLRPHMGHYGPSPRGAELVYTILILIEIFLIIVITIIMAPKSKCDPTLPYPPT